MKLPAGSTVHTWINALSIPLIAGILVMVLWWVLDADAWCGAQAELTSRTTQTELLRCGSILLKQLDIAFYVAVGLVATLSLAHLVSVFRDVKAQVDLKTALGSINVGGDPPTPAQAAAETAAAAEKKADEFTEDPR